jgi:plasmid rolling circle replication initiator protein Rep
MEIGSAALVAVSASGARSVFAPAENEYLTDYAPREKCWDRHRGDAQEAGYIYGFADPNQYEFAPRYAERIGKCSPVLSFGIMEDVATGNTTPKLKSAWFCKVRTCPVCQWRRALMHKARFLKAFDQLDCLENRSFIFLTLTVENPDITDLRKTLSSMSNAWMRFTKLKEFSNVLGWVRSTEVTWSDRPNLDSAHPHYHVLLMVRNSWFKKSYVSQASWCNAWKGAARLDYVPIVDVQKVKPRDENGKRTKGPLTLDELKKAVSETLKYSLKSEDGIKHRDWFLEFTRQVKALKFVTSGGEFNGWFKDRERATQQELLVPYSIDGEEEEVERDRIHFEFQPTVKRYARMSETRPIKEKSRAS